MFKKSVLFLLLSFFSLLHAQISLSPVAELPYSGISSHQVVADSLGHLHIIWLRSTPEGFVVETATRDLEEKWSQPSGLSQSASTANVYPKIIIDSLNRVHAFWVEKQGEMNCLKSSFRTLGGDWTSSETIAYENATFQQIQLAKDALGSVFASWQRVKISENSIKIQTSEKKGDAIWSHPIDLSPELGKVIGYHSLKADDEGNVYAAWTLFNSELYVQVAEKPHNGIWSSPKDMFTTPGLLWGEWFRTTGSPHLTISPSGEVHLACVEFLGDQISSIIATKKGPNNEWVKPDLISGKSWTNHNLPFPIIVADRLGNLFSAWRELSPNPDSWNLFVIDFQSSIKASHYSGERWTDPTRLSRLASESEYLTGYPRLAVDHLGNAVVVWLSKTIGVGLEVEGATFLKDKGWSEPFHVGLSQASQANLSLLIDEQQNVHISWLEGAAGQQVIKMVRGKIAPL
jgi:hypothetical protein